MRRSIIALLAAAINGPALAAPIDMRLPTAGYLYFNRPGADMVTHDSELRNCTVNWESGYTINKRAGPNAVPYNGSDPLSYGAAYGVGTAIAGAIQRSWMVPREHARLALNVEHCMVVRGWRLIRVADYEGAAFARLSRAELASKLADWVGSERPHGEVVRIWGNEATRFDLAAYHEPRKVDRTLLSELAADPAAPEPARQIEAKIVPDVNILRRYKPLNPQKLAAAPPGSAFLVLRVTSNESGKYKFGMEKEPESYNPENPFGWQIIPILDTKAVDGSREKIMLFAVPPGRWRMSGGTLAGFDMCMGAPSFRAAAGDVVYVGSFQLGLHTPIQPDMDLAPARVFLNATPSLAGQLRPADWINGSTSFCRGWSSYALEFPNFPFEEGYDWGSRAVISK